MSKDKLQFCISFKHTKEEEELYACVIGQNDKSVFIKNLIRNHLNMSVDVSDVGNMPPKKDADKKEKKLSHGKKTRGKYLA